MPIADGALHDPSSKRLMTIPLPKWKLSPKTTFEALTNANPTAFLIMRLIVEASTVSISSGVTSVSFASVRYILDNGTMISGVVKANYTLLMVRSLTKNGEYQINLGNGGIVMENINLYN